MHPLHIPPAARRSLSPFYFIGDQVLSSARHLMHGFRRSPQALSLDQSVGIKKRHHRNTTSPGLKKRIWETLHFRGTNEHLGTVIEVTDIVIRHASVKSQVRHVVSDGLNRLVQVGKIWLLATYHV